MALYTEETLDKLRKRELIAIMMPLQNRMEVANNNILEEIRKLREEFGQLEYDAIVTKQTNHLLKRDLLIWNNSVGKTHNTPEGNALKW